jgi:NAD-dependent dihydropyrimidine dehydrogenase PreA subunit
MAAAAKGLNTLWYDESLCTGCGACRDVCPHGVFAMEEGPARLVRPEDCMECGACQVNCPTGALAVRSGVGCAYAMIKAALTGKRQATCGPDPEAGSCRSSER